jgi:hypothetical protein
MLALIKLSRKADRPTALSPKGLLKVSVLDGTLRQVPRECTFGVTAKSASPNTRQICFFHQVLESYQPVFPTTCDVSKNKVLANNRALRD